MSTDSNLFDPNTTFFASRSMMYNGITMREYMERSDELIQMLRKLDNLTRKQRKFINDEIEHITSQGGCLNTLDIQIHHDLLSLYNRFSHQNLPF